MPRTSSPRLALRRSLRRAAASARMSFGKRRVTSTVAPLVDLKHRRREARAGEGGEHGREARVVADQLGAAVAVGVLERVADVAVADVLGRVAGAVEGQQAGRQAAVRAAGEGVDEDLGLAVAVEVGDLERPRSPADRPCASGDDDAALQRRCRRSSSVVADPVAHDRQARVGDAELGLVPGQRRADGARAVGDRAGVVGRRGRRARTGAERPRRAAARPRPQRATPPHSPRSRRAPRRRRRAAAAAASISSAWASLKPSLAHGSSNSTRHRPSSFCTSARRARNERPLRPLKPVTGFSVLPRAISSLGDGRRQVLARLGLPDDEAAARVLAAPAGVALAVLDDVVAADRARPEVGARDPDVLELGVELADRGAGELRDVGHERLALSARPPRSRPGAAPSRRSATARSAGGRRAGG